MPNRYQTRPQQVKEERVDVSATDSFSSILRTPSSLAPPDTSRSSCAGTPAGDSLSHPEGQQVEEGLA